MASLVKRKPVRFKPQKGVYAFVDPKPKLGVKKFSPKYAGLVLNQSFRGCALVIAHEKMPPVGDLIRVKLGPLEPLFGEVRWAQMIDQNVFKIGIFFRE